MLNFSLIYSSRSIVASCLAILFVAALTVNVSAIGAIEVVGTGDSQRLLREIARAYEAKHPGTKVIIPESIGSSGGIRAVASGRNFLARVARPLSEDEQQEGLKTLRFGISPVVFFVNKSVTGVEGLSRDEAMGIFSGGIRNWKTLGGPDETIYLVNRETGDSSLRTLSQHIPGFLDLDHPPESVFFSTPEAMEAIAANAQTIGYGPLAMQPEATRVLEYEGVFPSPENVDSGAYPMANPLLVVWKEELPSPYRSFVDFLFSPVAAEIMTAHGVWPSGR